MDIFQHWREQEAQSTMTRLMADNARLRREVRIKTIVYWTSLICVVLAGLVKLYGGDK